MLTKQGLDYANLNSLKPDRRENKIHVVQEKQLKLNQDENIFSQSNMHQPLHQQKSSTRDKKVVQIRPSAAGTSGRVQGGSMLQQPISNLSQLLAKQRTPECNSHLQHQRYLKPAYQRSHSSNVKLTKKPDTDHSPLRFDGRRSFSNNSTRSNWDERFNALSQSLKDICGSPRTSPLFTRSVTAPVNTQISKDHANQTPPISKSLLVPSPPHFQSCPKLKRSSDPYVRPKVAPRDTRINFDMTPSKGIPTVPRSSSLSSSLSRSPASKGNKGNKVGVTFDTRSSIKESDLTEHETIDLNIPESDLSDARYEGRDLDNSITNFPMPNPGMIASCPDGLPNDFITEDLTCLQDFEDVSQTHHNTMQCSSGLPPMSPKYSFSLPGSNFSSPGNTLVKANHATKPKAQMRRINSVFLETMNQPHFVIDPSFKKITVRHEETSKSLELELTRVLFSNVNGHFLNGKNKREPPEDAEIGAITYPLRSEFLYKVAIKPHKVALEDLFIELIGERTLRVGKLELIKTNNESVNVLEDTEHFPSFEAGVVMTNNQTISSTVLDEIVLPNELLGWTCSLTDDRRWLTVREVPRSAAVADPPQSVSCSSSPSVYHSFIDYSPKSSRAISDRKQTVPTLEYSSNCSARYQPIVVNQNNSSQLSIVMRIPDEFDPEELMIKRLDQKVIIKGKKKKVPTATLR